MPTLLLPKKHKDTKLSRSHELGCLLVATYWFLPFHNPPSQYSKSITSSKGHKKLDKRCLTNELEVIKV